MSRRHEKKLRAALDATNTALLHALEVTEAAAALLAETAKVRDQATATAELWRQLYQNKPRFRLLLVSACRNADR